MIDFPALSFLRIQLGAVSELRRAKVLSMAPNTYTDIVPLQTERMATVGDPAESDMNVRVTCVEVGHRDPFKRCAKIALHLGHQCACVGLQVHTLAKLRRNDQLEHPFVTCVLPLAQDAG